MHSSQSFRPSLVLALFCCASSASAQILSSPFSNDYAVDNINSVPGVPTPYGGLLFKDSDPNKLLIIGACNAVASAIYEVGVTRDTNGHVDGFAGPATLVANTPFADGALSYAPGGVLLYTTYEWPQPGYLGQIEPGSNGPDKLISLATIVGPQGNSGGVALVPTGFPGAGRLKLTDYDDRWWDAVLVPDGMGTFDVVNPQLRAMATSTGTHELASFVFVDATYPGFSAPSVLVCELGVPRVSAYELNANGDIVVATRRTFLSGGEPYFGSALDPLTGDFLFADWGGSHHVEVVRRLVGSIGTSYCGPAVPNSTGGSGTISGTGTSNVLDNDLALSASDLPNNAFGFFLTSRTQGLVNQPGGSLGVLCLGGAIGRYVGPGQIQNTGATGSFSLSLDLTQTPTPTGFVSVVAGETWNFQAWHRDAIGGAAVSNFTNGLSVTFD